MENVEIDRKEDPGFLVSSIPYLSHQTTARLHTLTFPLDFSFPPPCYYQEPIRRDELG